MNNDYLNYIQHSGILGQRWGIRRYQNKDGSLTPEGKVRYGDGVHTKNGKSAGKSESEKKKPEDMTIEELREANTRMKEIITYKDSVAKLTPKPVKTIPQKILDAGKDFTNKCVKDVGDKVARDVVAPYIAGKISSALNGISNNNRNNQSSNNSNNRNN